MSVWLARNKSFNKEDSFYQMFQSKPVKLIDGSDIDFHPSFGKRSFKLGSYCPSLMHKLSNMKLKPGTESRVSGRKRVRKARGAAVVEFAVVLPLLLTILFGIIEYGWVFMVRQTLQTAAREGARVAVLQKRPRPLLGLTGGE